MMRQTGPESSENSSDIAKENRRRSRADPGMVGEFIKIVLGGVAGLAIGYYVLVYFFGPQYNFLEINLPGLPRVTEPSPSQPVAVAPVEPEPASPTEPSPSTAVPPMTAPTAPAASQDAFPPDYVGPRQRQPYTADDLGLALAEAHARMGCANCGSTGIVSEVVVTGSRQVGERTIETKKRQRITCPECDGHPTYRINESAYEAWCRVAEILALADELAGPQMSSRMEAIHDLLRRSVSSPDGIDRVARQAAARLDSLQPSSAGVLLAARVRETTTQASAHVARLMLAGTGRELTLASDRPLPLTTGDRLLVLAAVIDKPRENLVGLATDEPQLLWHGAAFKVP